MTVLEIVTSPPEGSLIIEVEQGDFYKYDFLGLSNIYVKGLIDEQSSSVDWVKFNSLDLVHKNIREFLLEKESCLSYSEFTFLRKEIGITLVNFCEKESLDIRTLEKWKSGIHFANEIATEKLKRYFSIENRAKTTGNNLSAA